MTDAEIVAALASMRGHLQSMVNMAQVAADNRVRAANRSALIADTPTLKEQCLRTWETCVDEQATMTAFRVDLLQLLDAANSR